MARETGRGILFDLDGVLYNSDQKIDGAADAVRWVQESRIPHLFVTNTTSRPRSALVLKLKSFDIATSEDRILTPPVAAAQWLKLQGATAIATFVTPAAGGEFGGIPTVAADAEREASHVIVGDLGSHWDFPTLNRAFRLLHNNPQAVLIALGMTRYWMATDGVSLDAGPFVAALQYATGRDPVVFGKPAAAFFSMAAEKLSLPPSNILMIGDDVVTDVGGAQAAGFKGALVKTGKFRPADLTSEVKPDAVLDSVAQLPSWWAAH
jgi:HAD superfamily hydrolase (TIGR01458 family)